MTRRARRDKARRLRRRREARNEPTSCASAEDGFRGSGRSGWVAEDLAGGWDCGRAGMCGGIRPATGAVPARLPDWIHAVAGTEPGLPGAADGAASVGRLVGNFDPANSGSIEQRAAADGGAVPAHPVRTPEALRMDDRSVAHRT